MAGAAGDGGRGEGGQVQMVYCIQQPRAPGLQRVAAGALGYEGSCPLHRQPPGGEAPLRGQPRQAVAQGAGLQLPQLRLLLQHAAVEVSGSTGLLLTQSVSGGV